MVLCKFLKLCSQCEYLKVHTTALSILCRFHGCFVCSQQPSDLSADGFLLRLLFYSKALCSICSLQLVCRWWPLWWYRSPSGFSFAFPTVTSISSTTHVGSIAIAIQASLRLPLWIVPARTWGKLKLTGHFRDFHSKDIELPLDT